MGRCTSCGSFGTLEPISSDDAAPAPGMRVSTRTTTPLTTARTVDELSTSPVHPESTGIDELDRVLDGGLVPGQVVLLGAEPGFGKSTLSVEVLGAMARVGVPALYASGEESAEQIAARARRVGATAPLLKIVSTTTVEDVLGNAASMNAGIICVDSLQTMASGDVDGGIGGVSQSREASLAFKQYAKEHGTPIILVSQFTKSDDVAGSNQIPHAVDTILVGDSDRESPLKFLRTRKNRYGRVGLTGVFVHDEHGLQSVDDPAAYLSGVDDEALPGAALTIVVDGGRTIPVEVDALCSKAMYGSLQRQFDGIPSQHGRMLVARLTASAPGLDLDGMDTFVGTSRGLHVTDESADLAVLAAVASAATSSVVHGRTAWIGEVGLTGAIRGRAFMSERVEDAIRLGYARVVCGRAAAEAIPRRLGSKIDVTVLGDASEIPHVL